MRNKVTSLLLVSIFNLIVSSGESQIDTSYISTYDTASYMYYFKKNIYNTGTFTFASHCLSFSSNLGLVLDISSSDTIHTTHNRYHHEYKGVPIIRSPFFVHTDTDGVAIMANGRLLNGISLNITPALTQTDAFNQSLTYDTSSVYAWNDSIAQQGLKTRMNDTGATYYPNPLLCIVDTSNGTSSSGYILAYKINLSAVQPIQSNDYFIDAQSGDLILIQPVSSSACNVKNKTLKDVNPQQKPQKNSFSGMSAPPPPCTTAYCQSNTADLLFYGTGKTIYTERTFGNPPTYPCVWFLSNPYCGSPPYYGTLDYLSNNNQFTSSGSTSWGTNNQEATTAHFVMNAVHTYYSFVHGRSGYNNLGGGVSITVNAPGIAGNAQWWTAGGLDVGTAGNLNYPLVTFDVIGHEFTHGISQVVGLGAYSEEGNLNESFSDIFGSMIEYFGTLNYTSVTFTWPMADECTSGGIRDPSNPTGFSMPTTYNAGPYWATNLPYGTANGYANHINCSVQSYMYYLLCEGGSGTNDLSNAYCVDGITKAEAEQIAYRTLNTYVQSGETFSLARAHWIQAAKDLYGNNSNEVAQVTQAWYAVGVGSIYTGIVNIPSQTSTGTEVYNYNCEVNVQNFNAANGSNVTITSDKAVDINPFFIANSGSVFYAYIAPDPCTGAARLANTAVEPKNNMASLYQQKDARAEIYQVIPNPNDGHFILKSSNPENLPGHIKISDVLGKNVLETTVVDPQADIDISNLPAGMYIINADFNGNIFSKKMIKQ